MKTTRSHNTENNRYISPQEHVEGHKVCLTDVKIFIYILKMYQMCLIPELNQTQALDY